jgi:hypothetical protein
MTEGPPGASAANAANVSESRAPRRNAMIEV